MPARKGANTSLGISSHSRGSFGGWASQWEQEKEAREEENPRELPPMITPSPTTELMGAVRELAQIAKSGVPPSPLRAIRSLSPEQSCFLEILTRLEKSELLSTMRKALIEKKSIFAYELAAMIRQTIEKKLSSTVLESLEFLSPSEMETWTTFLGLETESSHAYSLASVVIKTPESLTPQERISLHDSSMHLTMKQITAALAEIWHYREEMDQRHVSYLRERLDAIGESLEIAHRTLHQTYTYQLNDHVSDAALQMLFTVVQESYLPLSIENRKALRKTGAL